MSHPDPYEAEILDAYESGTLTSVGTKSERDKLRAAARATAVKDRASTSVFRRATFKIFRSEPSKKACPTKRSLPVFFTSTSRVAWPSARHRRHSAGRNQKPQLVVGLTPKSSNRLLDDCPRPQRVLTRLKHIQQRQDETADANDITGLRHVRSTAKKRSEGDVVERTPCADFDRFTPLFALAERALTSGTRKTLRFERDA